MNHHQPGYAYPTNPVVASTMPSVQSQYYPTKPTSTRVTSATEFRGSTNPDEDWTKISDLAERRRIQNRIAQRNYRKKLKRRLEDLERRAASRSLSPNGDDTDGRSTRESSVEGGMVSPPPSSEPHLSHDRDNYPPPVSGPYTTASPYSPHYRTAGPYSTSPQYYPPATLGPAEPAVTDYSTPSQYIYSYSAPTLSSVVEATCGSPASTCSDQSYLPLPSARLSSSSSGYSVSTPPEFASPKASPMVYDGETMSPFYASYAGLTETPDSNFFTSQYYHDDHGSPHSTHSPPIKQEQ